MFSMQIKLNTYNSLKKKLNSNFSLEELALEVFNFQYKYNEVYKSFVNFLGISAEEVRSINAIPFLPIEFYKTHQVSCFLGEPTHIFESSGTSSETATSKHYVSDIQLYKESILNVFNSSYGHPSNYSFMGLLPSYLERSNASLVFMVDFLIKESGNKGGFYLHEYEALQKDIFYAKEIGKIPFVFGVSFALLEFAETKPGNYRDVIFVETGGMKGRRKELVRAELHDFLKSNFQVDSIQSEYGMTEMLSQAYAHKEGLYKQSNWMQIRVRDSYNPLSVKKIGKGLVNIIDLANIETCSFIATQDVGEIFEDGHFSILGRSDSSEVRGCNLMLGDW